MRYRFLDCTLDTDSRELRRAGEVVPVRARVYALLVHLIEHRNQAVSKDEIFARIWKQRIVTEATLSSCIKELRRAVGDDAGAARVVQTVRGHGFRFVAPVESVPVPDAPGQARRPGAEAMDEVMRAVLARRPARTRFVGRARELELLRERLASARAGHGQTVCLVGDPGIGKSRLVEELRQQALEIDGVTVIAAHCVPHHATTPYRPLAALLLMLCDCTARDTREVVATKVQEALDRAHIADSDALQLLLTLLDVPDTHAGAPDLAPDEQRRRTFRCLTSLILRRSLAQPLVVAVEDLHWIDASSEAWIAELVTRADTARLLLVLTCRPGYRTPWATSAAAVTQFTLTPLSPPESETLIASLAGSNPLHKDAVRRIVTTAQGNPFFLEELTSSLLDAQREPQATALPGSVQAVIDARLDQLEAADKQLLRVAAVLGVRFDVDLLASVCGCEIAQLSASLATLESRGFIHETHRPGAREYAFRHVLTQEVAYRSLATAARAGLHERVATALEQSSGQSAAEPELLGSHWDRAGRADRALSYWRRAGSRAIERSAHLEAVAQLQRALAADSQLLRTPAQDRERLDILLMLGPPLMATRGFADAEVEAHYLQSRELCARVASDEQRFVATWGLFLHNLHRGRIEVARTLLAEIFDLARRIDQSAYWLQAHHAGWTLESTHGDLQACLAHAERGIELYDPAHHLRHAELYGMHDPGLCAYGTAADAAWFLGKPDTALDRMEHMLQAARERGHPYSVLLAVIDLMWIRCLRREPQACAALAPEAVDLCASQGVPNHRAIAGILAGWARATTEDLDAGVAAMQASLGDYRALDLERHLAFFLLLLAECLHRQGAASDAIAALADARNVIASTSEDRWSAEVSRMRGLVMRDLDPGSDVPERALNDALTVARRQGASMLELRAATSLARLWTERGRRDDARGLLAPLIEGITEGRESADLKDARSALLACDRAL